MHFQVGDGFLPIKTPSGSFAGRIFSADRCALRRSSKTICEFTIHLQNLQQIEELRQQFLAYVFIYIYLC